MSSIDDRVVKMEFQNKQFESGVATTMSTLDKLKAKLKFKDEGKALDDLSKSANKVDLSPLASAVQTVSDRFSTLGVIGMTVLQNITTAAMATGQRLVSALTIDPMKSGLSEYELQIGSIQTILSNTRSKGTTLDQVNAALDELNTYADKTIYNFGQMTENIGRFTAAGVDLDTSVSSIKGLSNLAAASGSSTVQAASAMYQLSQAIAAGKIQLMDWNSIVNAGMGGELFQEALKRTARNFGTDVDGMIEKYGSFRESLTQGGWLTADVMTETLKQISGAYTEADLLSKGYTKEQAADILDLAQNAEDAATKVKTFTQLIDTLGEALGSGWAQSWRTIIGDFEEAQTLWSNVSEVLGGFINQQAEARNALLEGWAGLNGRTILIEALSQAFDNLASIVGRIGDAFNAVFPPMTPRGLLNMTKGLRDLMKNLEPSTDTLDRIQRIAQGAFSIFSILGQAIGTVGSAIGDFLGSDSAGGVFDSLLEGAARIGDFFTSIDQGLKNGQGLKSFGNALTSIFKGIADAGDTVIGIFTNFGDTVGTVGSKILEFAGMIKDGLGEAFSFISENFGATGLFAALAGGGTFLATKKLGDLFGTIKDIIDKLSGNGDKDGGSFSEIKDNITDLLDSVGDSIKAFTSGIKAGTLLTIAAAIGVLTLSIGKLSTIDPAAVTGSLMAIGVMMGELVGGLSLVMKVLERFDSKGVLKASIAMIAIAEAVNILASAVEKMSKLNLEELAKGLVGVGAGIGGLMVAIKNISGNSVTLRTSVAILAVAQACKMLAEAVGNFAGMSWDEIARGLTGMGGALGEVTIALGALSKIGGGGALLGGAGRFVAVQSLEDISSSLKSLSELSWDDIGRGLAAMGGALGEFTIALSVLSKVGGGGALLGGAGITVAAQSLEPIANTLSRLSKLSWDDIGRGLAGMGGALAELGTIATLVGRLGGFSSILGSGSVLIAAQALEPIANTLSRLSNLTWDDIQRGLVAMGGAFTELGGISAIVGRLGGLSSLVGGGTILLAAQALEPIATSLQKIGGMSWEEIARGLVGMGGALTELGVISGLVGNLGGPLALLGSATITTATQGLMDLANALEKFGSMSWDEIGRGLAAMGAALGETALGGLLNTLSGFGAESIATIAGPLGTLADSVKKWTTIEVPTGLGEQLGQIARGVEQFTFAGMGGGAISTVAAPLGTLADSVKKWTTVTVPDGIEGQLKGLAHGVQEFTFAGLGGVSIGMIAEPIGTLAGSVKKWNGVTIPEGIENGLKELARGCGEFTLTGFSAGGMSEIAGPLGEMASAVRKWNGTTITEGLGQGLTDLAKGISALANADTSGGGLDTLGTAIQQIGTAAQSLQGLDLSGVTSTLSTFAMTLSQIPTTISNLGSALSGTTASVMVSFGSTLTAGITGASSAAIASLTAMFITMNASITMGMASAGTLFTTGAATWMRSLGSGISQNGSVPLNAVKLVMQKCVTAVRDYRDNFQSAGNYAMSGLASGISKGGSNAIEAAAKVARRALAAAKAELDIQSPSKAFEEVGIFSDQGLANGFLKAAHYVTAAASGVASSALDATSKGLQSIGEGVNGKTLSASIRPVITGKNARLFSSGARISANLDTRALNSDIASLTQVMAANEAAMAKNNLELKTAIESLKENVDSVADAVSQMQWSFNVDGKALAHATAKPMNRELQILSKRGSL